MIRCGNRVAKRFSNSVNGWIMTGHSFLLLRLQGYALAAGHPLLSLNNPTA
jgi:hypothetical protein